jgi:crotonobetainyl-CoA:carnitine CoA-transferase CaiB-like acyl-CoA transferase
MSGLMSITGPEGGEPVRVGVSIGDIAAGLFAAVDIVANLFARDRDATATAVPGASTSPCSTASWHSWRTRSPGA